MEHARDGLQPGRAAGLLEGLPGRRRWSRGERSGCRCRGPARSDLCTAYRKDGSVIGQYRYRLNGHIGTQLSADLRYGVAAARVRFQQSRGQHGAFWLQPTRRGAGLDVAERRPGRRST